MYIFKWATRWTTSTGIRMLCMSTGQQLLKLKRIIERIEIKNEKRKRVQETMQSLLYHRSTVHEETIARQQRQIQALEQQIVRMQQQLQQQQHDADHILDWFGTWQPEAWDAYMNRDKPEEPAPGHDENVLQYSIF